MRFILVIIRGSSNPSSDIDVGGSRDGVCQLCKNQTISC